jgi:starch phosphorylase
MSLIAEDGQRRVRMAHLAIVGSHSTNGVAAIHTKLLRETTVRDFAEMYPERFSNKTNGITPRRWLLVANPALAELITETIGPGWITDLTELERLTPLAEDAGFRHRFLAAKRLAKRRFVRWLAGTQGIDLDPTTLFDTQIKRIHEYKRQLLAALGVVVTYNRLRNDPHLDVPPQTHLFAGKAAPAYHLAKVIIRLITSIGRVVNHDPAVRGRLRVEFLPNYSVSLAERLIPASDVSEQISTAGYEASGTSNMKFMLNGAVTIGTRDGATVEIADAVGEDNIMLFGLSASDVAGSRGWYSPSWHYHHEPELRAALDLIFNNHFCREEPGAFEPIREALLHHGDPFMHLADLAAYMRAKERVWALAADPDRWAAVAIRNVAMSGRFSSDRTIGEYARDIWRAQPCPVEPECAFTPGDR